MIGDHGPGYPTAQLWVGDLERTGDPPPIAVEQTGTLTRGDRYATFTVLFVQCARERVSNAVHGVTPVGSSTQSVSFWCNQRTLDS